MSNYGPTTTVFPGNSISPEVIAQLQKAVAPNQAATYQSSGLSPLNPYTGQDAQNAQAQMGAINAAGPDVFDRAITSVRDDRRALLDSIAAAGSAGKAEYQRQAEQSAASKQTAISAALAAAQQHGNTDPGTLAAIQQQISRPYDEGTSARDASSANWQNLFSAIGGANDAYFAKYADSLPVIQQQFRNDLATNFATTRADAQREIAKSKMASDVQLAQLQLSAAQDARTERERAADQAAAAQQQALDNAFRQKQFDENVREYGLDYALKQQQLAKSGSGGGGGGGSGFGGTGMTQSQFKAAVPSAIAGLRQGIDPNNIFGSTLGKIVGLDKAMNQLAGHNIGLQNNISDALMASVMPKYASGIGQTGQGIMAPTGVGNAFGPNPNYNKTNLTQGQLYGQARDAIKSMLAAHTPPQQIIQKLHEVDLSPATNKAISDYLPGWG